MSETSPDDVAESPGRVGAEAASPLATRGDSPPAESTEAEAAGARPEAQDAATKPGASSSGEQASGAGASSVPDADVGPLAEAREAEAGPGGSPARDEAPVTEAPVTEAPETEGPETEGPETEAPALGAAAGEPPAPPVPLVVLEGLRIGGAGARPELCLSAQFFPGVTGIVGPSGVGKTLLCETLLGLAPIKRGAGGARVLGHALPQAGPRVRAEVGYLPQDLAVYPGMTALEFAEFFGQAQLRWRAKQVFERLARYQVPTRVPLEQLGPRPRAFLALVLALGSSPRLVVADLPTCLDGGARAELLEALLAERGEASLVLATDRPHELEGRCRDLLLLGGGCGWSCPEQDLARGVWRLDLRGSARPPLHPELTCIQAGPGPSGARWIVAGEESLLPSDPELVSSLRPATFEESALARIAGLAAQEPKLA